MDDSVDKKQNKEDKKVEEALNSIYKEKVEVDTSFKENLDKIVSNSIQAEIFSRNDNQKTLQYVNSKKRGLFATLFKGVKWQGALLMSCLGFLLVGGVVFAAFEPLREAVKEVVAPTKGTLFIDSDPQGAEVYILGEDFKEYENIGITPLKKKIKEGSYSYKLVKEGYEEYEEELNIMVGEETSTKVTLEKLVKLVEYLNKEYGFKLGYPEGWTVETREGTVEGEFYANFTGKSSEYSVAINSVNVETVEMYSKIETEELDILGETKIIEKIDFSKDGKESRYRYGATVGLGIQENGKPVRVWFYSNENFQKDYDTFKRFLQTIEFFEPVEVDPYEGWKDYENSDLNMKIKVPNYLSAREEVDTVYFDSVEIGTPLVIYKMEANTNFEEWCFIKSSVNGGSASVEEISGIELGEELEVEGAKCFINGMANYYLAELKADDSFYLNFESGTKVMTEEDFIKIINSFSILFDDEIYEGWNIYNDDELDIKFYYPGDWTVSKYVNEEDQFFVQLKDLSGVVLYDFIVPNGTDTLDEYLVEYGSVCRIDSDTVEYKDMQIGANMWRMLTAEVEENGCDNTAAGVHPQQIITYGMNLNVSQPILVRLDRISINEDMELLLKSFEVLE